MDTSQNNSPQKPKYITDTATIPSELKQLAQWLCFNLEGPNQKGKWTKVPYQINGDYKASSTNPKSWNTFQNVYFHACALGSFDGIGFVFTKQDPYCGIDLDNCVNPVTKEIAPWALRWLELFRGAYMEFSPSGTGIKIFTKAKLSCHGRKVGDIEIYDQARYFTVTGNVYGELPKEIPFQQAAVDQLLAEVFSNAYEKNNAIDKTTSLQGDELTRDEIDQIIKKARSAKNAEKFSKLFDGDYARYHKSHSEADAALCAMLAFYTNGNEFAINQIFRESNLYRPKWDRPDYCASTIRKAIKFTQASEFKRDFESLQEDDGVPEETGPFPIIHIAAVEEKQIEYQIQDLWLKSTVGIISGQPGSCKTWFSLELLCSIAAGIKAFGAYQAVKGRVLAFNAEDDPSRITKHRVRGFCNAHKIQLEDLDFHLINIPSMDLADPLVQQRLTETIEKYRPDFIVLDPLRDIHSLNEDNSSEMSPMLRFLRKLNRKFHCSILLVCHDKKPAKENNRYQSKENSYRAAQTRGTNAIQGWRDTAFYLDEVDSHNKISLVQNYHRFAQSVAPFHIKLTVTSDGAQKIKTALLEIIDKGAIHQVKEDKLGKEIENLIQKHGRMTRDQVRRKLGIQNNLCREAIRSLIDFGKLKEEKEGKQIFIAYSVQPGTGTPS